MTETETQTDVTVTPHEESTDDGTAHWGCRACNPPDFRGWITTLCGTLIKVPRAVPEKKCRACQEYEFGWCFRGHRQGKMKGKE